MAFKVLHCFLVFLHRTAAFVLKVPRFLRLPVFGFFLREYSRYLPDFSFLHCSVGYSHTKQAPYVEL